MKAGDSVQQIPIPWNLKGKNNSSHHLFFCKKNNGEHNNWYNIFAVYLPNHGYSLLGTEASLKSGSNDTFQLVTTDDLEARWEDRMIQWVRVTVCHRCVSHFFVTDVCDIYIYMLHRTETYRNTLDMRFFWVSICPFASSLSSLSYVTWNRMLPCWLSSSAKVPSEDQARLQ